MQYEDEFLEMIGNDVRYAIAFFMLLPIIAGDFLVIKLLAIVSYCMDIVIVENIFIRVDGEFEKLTVQ